MRLRRKAGNQKLNTNEYKVLKAMVKQAWDETGGEFGYTDTIKVNSLSKHQVAGYIGDLEKKGYISIYPDFNQFLLRKKVLKKYLIMWKFILEVLKLKSRNKELINLVSMVTKEQREFIQNELKKHPELKPLRKKLLSFGGKEIVPREEPDLSKIIKRGKLFKCKAILTKLRMISCHTTMLLSFMQLRVIR